MIHELCSSLCCMEKKSPIICNQGPVSMMYTCTLDVKDKLLAFVERRNL